MTRFPALRLWSFVRAVRDLPGPVYIHCHHGLHRGPTAAALAFISIDGWSNENAIAAMKEIGTARTYKGLYRCVREFQRPESTEIDTADDQFREVADVPSFAQTMARIDRIWDCIKLIKKSRWGVPQKHPDIDPSHEVLQLLEMFRKLNRQPEMQARSPDFRERMRATEAAIARLQRSLRERDHKASNTHLQKNQPRLHVLSSEVSKLKSVSGLRARAKIISHFCASL